MSGWRKKGIPSEVVLGWNMMARYRAWQRDKQELTEGPKVGKEESGFWTD